MLNSLSVTDYLASVARTPTPRRFDRCHQRILEGKPRLTRVSHVIRKAARSTGSLQNIPQGKRNCPLVAFAAAISPDIGPPESLAHSSFKSTIRIGSDARAGGPGFEDEGSYFEDQEEGSGMFISTDSIDHEQEISDLEREILNLGGGGRVSYNRQEQAKLIAPCSPSQSQKRLLSHKKHNSSTQDFCNGSTCDDTQGDVLPSHKKKSREVTHKDLQTDTEDELPSIRRAHVKRKHPRQPRRLPVNKLVLFGDSTLLEVPSDSQCEDEDPIEDSESESRRKKKLRARNSLSRSRKSRKRAKFEVSGATLDDLSKFKMPKFLEISPNARKRLGISLKCRDGFVGREVRRTGKSMSMALPSHCRKLLKAGFTLAPALTLVSQPSSDEYNQNSQEDSGHDQCTTNSNTFNNRIPVMAHEGHYSDRTVASYGEMTKIASVHDDTQQDDLQQMQWIAGNDGENPRAAPDQTPQLEIIPRSRIAFIDDEKVLQSLSMVSAPIASTKSNSSDNSDERTDDNDSTNSDSTDEDRSTPSKDEDSDSDTNLDTDEETEDNHLVESEALPQPKTPTRVAVQELETEWDFTPSSEITVTQAVQKLALTDDFVIHNLDSAFDNLFNPEMIVDEWDMQRYESKETPTKIVGPRQELEVPDPPPWMPRRPILTNCLIEVDEDIEDDTSSQISTRLTTSSASAGGAGRRCFGQGRCSRGSIELGDPNWITPYCQTEEVSQFQSQIPKRKMAKHKATGHQVSLVPISSARASQQQFPIVSRSTTVPWTSRPPFDGGAQVEHASNDIVSSHSFRSTTSPRRLPFSQLHTDPVQSTTMGEIRRRTTAKPGIVPVRGRVRSLPLIPPFLKS